MTIFLCSAHFTVHILLLLLIDVNEESPPEPAPPEVPPRGPSLHSATLRRRTEYSLPVAETGQNNQESQFLQQGGKLLHELLSTT